MTEHRHTHRVNFDTLVEFETIDFNYTCELVDISVQGALLATGSAAIPDVGTQCKITIRLDEGQESKIIMIGHVAREMKKGIGIHCDSIDVDSMTHLRRLVEYNLGDVELVHRDFDALIHDHN